jgi:hypothetical protein
LIPRLKCGIKIGKSPSAKAASGSSYFYLQTGAHTVISRSHATVDHREAGHRLLFEIDTDKVHLFDPATGLRIR